MTKKSALGGAVRGGVLRRAQSALGEPLRNRAQANSHTRGIFVHIAACSARSTHDTRS